ncbi:MAG: putative Ig domain-containing protein [Trebonia sp.]
MKTTALPPATAGVSYSAKLAASGGIAPYTWSVKKGALPAGLTLVPATGLIAGIPAAGSTASFTVKVSDSESPSASASATLSITVTTAPLMINTPSLPAATAGVSYSAKLAAAGGIKPYTWSVTNGALPAGLSLDPATGAISGKPTAPGTAIFRVNVSDAEKPSVSASQGLNITVTVAPLAITTVSVLPGLTSGMPYSVKLAADGGLTPYTWSITQGSLPAGLKLHAATGVISGTPTSGSGSTFTAEVSDAQNPPATASATFSLSANTVTVSSPGPQTTIQNGAVSLQIAAIDSAAGQALTYSATGLPAGLSISSSGLISGTSTTPGPYNVKVTATDGTGASGSATFTWTVNPTANTVTVTNPGPQTTIQNGPVSLQIAAGDSAAGQALTYSATGLPAGLSISSSGQITGLAVTGTFNVTVTATDGTGASGSATFTWTVSPPIVIGLAAGGSGRPR